MSVNFNGKCENTKNPTLVIRQHTRLRRQQINKRRHTSSDQVVLEVRPHHMHYMFSLSHLTD